ncbi:fatty acid desaturase [Paraburkholderia sp. BR14374]|uniref:fatty acid desaturase n=1 Tax=Paraburkholderia sp. BR14374 TaxID=3237007 RepID=UPI0034CE3DE3
MLFWLVPYLTTFQALGWFIELAEHSPMCETETEDVYLTRNRKGNLIERLLVGANLDEYHLEHHLSPGVPFWHLKRAQKIRLRDPRYAEVAESWGGLFASGPKGQPSVINQLLDRNRRLYEAQRGRLAGEGVVNE